MTKAQKFTKTENIKITANSSTIIIVLSTKIVMRKKMNFMMNQFTKIDQTFHFSESVCPKWSNVPM